ncbi:putative UDP-sugar hydrolase [Aspergillus foveolatus]|uniref:putative UDP-sugar hydrolase n=1 Tax=Aspergillus foveolatus TaxID=210207 RepID=UPI003CCD5B13
MSLLRMMIEKDEKGRINVSAVGVEQYRGRDFAPLNSNTRVSQLLDSIHSRVDALVQEPLLHSHASFDGRGSVVRSQETNLGNMVATAVRAFYDTDIAFFNSGSIRCNQALGPTTPNRYPLLVKDIINICPFENPLLVKRISGRILLHAMENSIGDMHLDGRFLQIAGLRLVATWQRKPGHRTLDMFLDQPGPSPQKIDPSRTYTVALPKFIADGFDGFTLLPAEQTIVDEETAITDTGLMLRVLGHGPESECDDHAVGIQRAQAVTIVGKASDGLPIVNPAVDGRIRLVECPAL